MDINLTLLGTNISLALFIMGLVLGPIVVYKIAKERVDHVARSTIFAIFLSILGPLVLLQIYFLLENDLESNNQINA